MKAASAVLPAPVGHLVQDRFDTRLHVGARLVDHRRLVVT